MPRLARPLAAALTIAWLGMSPLWVMGEALTPGRKVGTSFLKGTSELQVAAADLHGELGADEAEIAAQLAQEVPELQQQAAVEVALSMAVWQVEELDEVGVLEDRERLGVIARHGG